VNDLVLVTSTGRSALRRALFSSLVLAWLFACGTEDSADRGFTVRDSAGITIVESVEPAWEEGEGWTLSAEPILDIGVVEGEPAYQFDRVRDVTRAGTGDVVVANGGPQEIRVFDSAGRFIRSVGGQGDGPGEFGRLAAVQARAADTVLALDIRRPRILAFGPSGNLLWSSTFGLESGPSMGTPASLADGWVPDRRVWIRSPS